MTPEETKLQQDSDEFNTTVTEGAVAGALTGALIGALTGDWKGAVIGLAAGAATGALAGSYIANKKQKYASEEERLDSMLVDVRTDNQKMASILTDLQAVVDQQTAKIASLHQEAQTSTDRASDLRAAVVMARQDSQRSKKLVDTMHKKRDDYQVALADAKSATNQDKVAQLQQQVDEWNGKVQQAEAQVKSLDDAIALSGVG